MKLTPSHDDFAEIEKRLTAGLSFAVPGAEFAPTFRNGTWDGRSKVFRRNRGAFDFERGLMPRVAKLLDGLTYTYSEDGPPRVRSIDTVWTGHEPRDYQLEAVRAALVAPYGRAVLALPIRSGKTTCAARIADATGQRTLFVAPSDFLVAQARETFVRSLSGARVTVVGSGENDDTGDVVIASIQALAARSETAWWKTFRTSFGTCFIDEAHHVVGFGDAWADVVRQLECVFKIGLSGTVPDDLRSTLLLERAIGPVVYRVGLVDLIARGVLVRPSVTFVKYDAPSMPERWQKTTYSDGIVKCDARNKAIASATFGLVRDGFSVLVDTSRVGHARMLVSELRAELKPKEIALLTGSTSVEDRDRAVAGLRAGVVKVVVGTVLGEGVDIPELGAVVNAEGGGASASATQRLRCMTPHEGKHEAKIVDFVDVHHPAFARQTEERLRLYRSFKFPIAIAGAIG